MTALPPRSKPELEVTDTEDVCTVVTRRLLSSEYDTELTLVRSAANCDSVLKLCTATPPLLVEKLAELAEKPLALLKPADAEKPAEAEAPAEAPKLADAPAPKADETPALAPNAELAPAPAPNPADAPAPAPNPALAP